MRGNISKRRFIGAGVVNHGFLLALETCCCLLGLSCFPFAKGFWLTSSDIVQDHVAVIIDGRAGGLLRRKAAFGLASAKRLDMRSISIFQIYFNLCVLKCCRMSSWTCHFLRLTMCPISWRVSPRDCRVSRSIKL